MSLCAMEKNQEFGKMQGIYSVFICETNSLMSRLGASCCDDNAYKQR